MKDRYITRKSFLDRLLSLEALAGMAEMVQGWFLEVAGGGHHQMQGEDAARQEPGTLANQTDDLERCGLFSIQDLPPRISTRLVRVPVQMCQFQIASTGHCGYFFPGSHDVPKGPSSTA